MTNKMRVIDSNRAVQRDEHGNPVVPSFYFDLQERGVIQQSIELLCLTVIKVIQYMISKLPKMFLRTTIKPESDQTSKNTGNLL